MWDLLPSGEIRELTIKEVKYIIPFDKELR